MNDQDFHRIEELFQAAADLAADERVTYLDEACAEGGFGVVYMAEQLEPVRRKVALKIIKVGIDTKKVGMDTKEVVARFEAERQALALMDHPSIAKVLDGGVTAAGRPYFVMELVRGISITDYCDQNQAGVRERLELFIEVCLAVQHAHQKGVIHRDIKPSNVLVALCDGKPVPKVIVFGIAKAMHTPLPEKTLFNLRRPRVGIGAGPRRAAVDHRRRYLPGRRNVLVVQPLRRFLGDPVFRDAGDPAARAGAGSPRHRQDTGSPGQGAQ